jgi:DNA polymerase III epsilon subunit-like protein
MKLTRLQLRKIIRENIRAVSSGSPAAAEKAKNTLDRWNSVKTPEFDDDRRERDPAVADMLADMWRSTNRGSWKKYWELSKKGSDDGAWSAAFISYVEDDPSFIGSIRHSEYMDAAEVERERFDKGENTAGKHVAFYPGEIETMPGDKRCHKRSGGKHCDVCLDPGCDSFIGGNIDNDIRIRSDGSEGVSDPIMFIAKSPMEIEDDSYGWRRPGPMMEVINRRLRRAANENALIESRYFGMSVADILSYLEGFGNNTWIFFDTETTGFEPRDSQLTEIGAVAINPRDWNEDPEILGEFNEKIKLNSETIEKIEDQKSKSETGTRSRGKSMTVPDILSMTRYGEKGRDYLDENTVIDGFLKFVDSFSSPVLVAQNAAFDMKFISVRSGDRMKRYPVIDTMRIMQLFLIPLLRTLRAPPHNDKKAAELLSKLKKGKRYSSSMGVVSGAYGISTDEWHNALADVRMLMQLLRHVVQTLRSGEEVDIRPEHSSVAAYQARRKKR